MHSPVTGFVWQSTGFTASVAFPVSADTVMLPLAPAFVVATAKNPVPVTPGIFTIPSFVDVAATAMMSGTGVADTVSLSVLTPTIAGAESVFEQLNPNCTSVVGIATPVTNEIRKLWPPPGGMSTGVFGEPIASLVAGSVA